MKKLLFGLVATIMLGFTGNAQVTVKDVRNSYNLNDTKGESYYNYLKTMTNSLNKGETTYNSAIEEINSESFKFKTNVTKDYISKYEIYFKKFGTDLVGLISLEKEIIANEAIADKSGLFEIISYIKWSAFYNYELSEVGKRCYSCWEACTNSCMKRKLSEIWDTGNWIDQGFFIISAPGSTAQMYASCSWDCRKKL